MDFTYEVSRSLAACEGALLVVDATQGVQVGTPRLPYASKVPLHPFVTQGPNPCQCDFSHGGGLGYSDT